MALADQTTTDMTVARWKIWLREKAVVATTAARVETFIANMGLTSPGSIRRLNEKSWSKIDKRLSNMTGTNGPFIIPIPVLELLEAVSKVVAYYDTVGYGVTTENMEPNIVRDIAETIDMLESKKGAGTKKELTKLN